jgi:hypothetical protein
MTPQQLGQAYRRALDAGDVAAADEIAIALNQLTAQEEAPAVAEGVAVAAEQAEQRPGKTAFLNRGLAEFVGSPVDAANLAMGSAFSDANAVLGAAQAAGEAEGGLMAKIKALDQHMRQRGPSAPLAEKPLGGKESLAAGLRFLGMPVADVEPETRAEKIIAGIGGFIGSATPSGIAARLMTKVPGVTGKIAKQIDDFLVKSPTTALASEIGGGAGMALAEDMTKDSESAIVRAAAPVVGALVGGGIPVVLSGSRQTLTGLADRLETEFAPSRKLGQDVVEIIHQATGKVAGAKFSGSIQRKRINKLIEESPEPGVTNEQITQYLLGTRPALPRSLLSVKDDLIDARRQIKRYQDELLVNHHAGQRVLPDSLVKQLYGVGGEAGWLKRQYQAFSDPDWKATSKMREDAIQEMMATPRVFGNKVTRPMSRGDAEKIVAGWDNVRNADDAMFSVYKSGRDAGIITPRKDLGPAVRAYLGEIRGAGERFEGSLISIAKLAAYDTADMGIASSLKRAGVTRVAEQGLEGYVPLKLRRGPAYLDGEDLFVPAEVQKSLDALYGSKALALFNSRTTQALFEAVNTGVSVTKATLVPLNLVPYSTNAITNAGQVLAQGMLPFRAGTRGAKATFATFGPAADRLSRADSKYVARLTELGITNPGFATADILAGLQGKHSISQFAKKLIEPAGKAYSLSDTFLRISVYENAKDQMMKEFPRVASTKAGIEALERAAAQQTNATYQQYPRLNQNVQALSRVGILGQFVAFNLEMLRNQFNQVMLIRSKLNGTYAQEMKIKLGTDVVDEKAIRNNALQRIVALSAVYGAGLGGVKLYNETVGGMKNNEERKAYQETVLPEYLSNKTVLINKGEDGKVQFKNAEYLIPHLATASPVSSAFDGATFPEVVKNFASTFVSDFGGELALFFRNVADAYMNPALSQDATKLGQFMDRLGFLAEKTLKPQGIRELEKTFGPNPQQTIAQLSKRLSGLRVSETTIEDGATRTLRPLAQNMRRIRSSVSYAELEGRADAIPGLQNTFDTNQEAATRHIKNLRTIGESEDSIINILRGSGISGRDALSLIDSQPIDIRPNARRTSADVWDTIEAAGLKVTESKDLREIRSIVREEPDIDIRRGLERRIDRELSMARRNLSQRDRVVMGLGVENGERADYIKKRMDQSPDPEGYLRDMQRKGIATPDVMRQIRMRQEAR